MEIVSLPAAEVGSWSYARNVNMERVKELAESIREIGLLSPVIVVRSTDTRNGRSVENWDVVAGRHRLKAMTSILHWTEIPCIVTDATGLKAELMTIDENLRRRVLSDAERAYQTSRRKEIYEALHPEVSHGGDRTSAGEEQVANVCDLQKAPKTQRFSAATAKSLGVSERTVQLDARRGEKLGKVLQRIADTSLDKGVEIDALLHLAPEAREEVVAKAEAGENISARDRLKIEREVEKERKAEAKRTPGQKAYRKRVEKTREQEEAAREKRIVERDAAVAEAVGILTARLGEDLGSFVSLLGKADLWYLRDALEKAISA